MSSNGLIKLKATPIFSVYPVNDYWRAQRPTLCICDETETGAVYYTISLTEVSIPRDPRSVVNKIVASGCLSSCSEFKFY